jgi:hypothetical protein
MGLTEMQHEPTGMSFRKWLHDPGGLPIIEPMGLIEIARYSTLPLVAIGFNRGIGWRA